MNMKIGVNMHNFYDERQEIEQSFLPCPFCGGDDIEFALIHPQYNGKPEMAYWSFWQIWCSDCGCSFEEGVDDQPATEAWEKAKENIIAAWNRRAS